MGARGAAKTTAVHEEGQRWTEVHLPRKGACSLTRHNGDWGRGQRSILALARSYQRDSNFITWGEHDEGAGSEIPAAQQTSPANIGHVAAIGTFHRTTPAT